MTHEPDRTVDRCEKNVSHGKKHFLKKNISYQHLDALNTRKSSTAQETPYLAVFGQSPTDLSNFYLGSRAPLEEEVEHLMPDINNQDVVSEPLLQVNDEVPDIVSTSSKVDRDGK